MKAEGDGKRWYPQSPRAGAKLRPIGLDFPRAMESGYAATRKQALGDHAQATKDKKKVQALTDHRLNVASKKFQKDLDDHEAKAQKEYLELGQKIGNLEVSQKALNKASKQDLAQFGNLTSTQEAVEAAHWQQQRVAEEQTMQTSDAQHKRAVLTEQHLHGVLEVATQAVHASQCDAKAKLEVMSQKRSQIKDDCEREIDLCMKETQKFCNMCADKGEADVLHSEIVRKKAAIAVTCAEAKTSSTQNLSKKVCRTDEDVASKEIGDAKRIVHELQQHCDAAVKMETYCSAKALQVAHDHCHFTEVDLAKAVASYNARMLSIKEDMAAYTKDVERNVAGLEKERIAKFQESFAKVEESMNSFEDERLKCNGSLTTLAEKLKEVHEKSKSDVDKICELWVQGSKACEEAVRELERQGYDSIAKMQSAVKDKIKQCNMQNAEIQRSGVQSVSQLESTAMRVIVTTQPNLEDARRANEEAAAAATAKYRQLRQEPDKITAEADEFISAEMTRANDEIQRLADETEAKIKACKEATIAARNEEEQLTTDSAAAWIRMREGCFELRRLDLHDMCQRIAAGHYDKYD